LQFGGNSGLPRRSVRAKTVPLRFGAGLKGKVFDGFLSGTPTVMSPIAGEGIVVDNAWTCADPDSFAQAAVELYSDPDLWRTRQSAERVLCRNRFDSKHWMPGLNETIQQALENRAVNRERNFIGRMLRHHHHRSTEFMSRWIEAKNKPLK